MKKKFKHSQQMGLPGGPNEVFTYTTGVFSSQGYKSNSPDVNNPFNIIPSRHITMKEDNGNPLERYQEILGIGSNGDSQIMTSGNDYTFQRGPVLEIPIAQNGKETEKSFWDMGTSYVNPYNWGVEDYTDAGSFDKAYAKAKKAGEKEFMYNYERYNVDYAGSPQEEFDTYGITSEQATQNNFLRNALQKTIKADEARYGYSKYQEAGDWNIQGKTNEDFDAEADSKFTDLYKIRNVLSDFLSGKPAEEQDPITQSIFNLYLGLPVDERLKNEKPENRLRISDYSKEDGKQYYKLDNVWNYISDSSELLNQGGYDNVLITPEGKVNMTMVSKEKHDELWELYWESKEKGDGKYQFMPGSVPEDKDGNKIDKISEFILSPQKEKLEEHYNLGNFYIRKGEDDKGTYVEYYDKWDLHPTTQSEYNPLNWAEALGMSEDQSQGIGKPLEFYDKKYYTLDKNNRVIYEGNDKPYWQEIGKKEMGGEYSIAQNGIETGIQKPGDGYEYRKEGDNFYTRKEGKENWTKASGTALDHIKYKIYGEGEAPKKDYSRVINRMRSILPDINSHDFSTEAYWSPGGEFDQLSPERQAYAEYGNQLGRGEITHDPNSPEGKAFEKYARRIASPEAWMKLYPQTMGQIFDPTNDPNKFRSIKKSWGDATPFDVELSMMDKTSFDPVNVQDAKSQGVAYQQDAQMYDQINKESDIVQQKEKDEAADASEKLRMETGVDRFGNAVPQWELAAYNNPNINSPDDYYNYLQRGGLEVEAGQFFGTAAELTQVPGMYRTIKRVGDEGFKPLVSDVLNTGADVLSTIGEGVYEAGDYAFGDGSFDMSGKNYITGKDKWTGLDRTLDALGFVPFAGAFGAGGKLLRTGSKLKNVAGAGTKAAVGKVFKPVQKLVDKASDIKVGSGYLGEYAPTIGEGAGFINKNVLKKNLNPFSKGPKYTTWDGLKHKGMYGTIMGDNTMGDVVSGDFNATKSNLLRPFIVGADEFGLIGDERKTQDVQNVIDQGVQVSDVAKTGLNFSGAPINQATFGKIPYFGKTVQKVVDTGLQMGGSTSAQNGKETKKDYSGLIRRMNDLLPAQTYGTDDETYFSYELPKLLEKRPEMEAIINFGYELDGYDISTLTPQEKKDLANSEAGQAFLKYARRLAGSRAWMTLYPETMGIFFDPDNDPNKFKSLKKKWGKYSAKDVEALGVSSLSFDQVNPENIKKAKQYTLQERRRIATNDYYSQLEKEKRDAEADALEEQDKLERGIGQPFELYNYNAGQKVFKNNEEYYAWKNNEGDYSMFQNPLPDIKEGIIEGAGEAWDATKEGIGEAWDASAPIRKELYRIGWDENPNINFLNDYIVQPGIEHIVKPGVQKLDAYLYYNQDNPFSYYNIDKGAGELVEGIIDRVNWDAVDQSKIGIDKKDKASTERNLKKIREYLFNTYGQSGVDKFNAVYEAAGSPYYTDKPAAYMMFQLPGKSQQNVGNINLGNLDRWRKELLGYDRPLTEKEKKSKKYKADYAAFGDKMTIPVAPLSDEQIKSKYDAYFNIYDDSGVLLDPEDWTPKSSIIVDPKNSSFDSVIKDKDGNPVYNLNEAQKILAGKVKTDPVTGKKVYRPNHFRNSLFYVDKNGNYHIANAGRPSYDPIRNVMHVDKDTYAKQMYDLTMAELTHGLQNQRYGTKELLKNFLTNAGPGGSRYHRDPRNPKSNLYSDGMGQLSKQIQDYYKKNKSATGGFFPYAEQYVKENIPGYYRDHGKGEFS